MSGDIRKNNIDENVKNSDNIVDIEAFAGEYEADGEFENLIKSGLESSWDDLGLSVSDDLIARTMDAIKNADDAAKMFPEAAKTSEVVTAPAGHTASAAASGKKKANIKRISRIAAGIAAAALIGILGISVIKNSLFLKKSNDSSAAPSVNINSSDKEAEPAATAEHNGSFSKSEAPAAANANMAENYSTDTAVQEPYPGDMLADEDEQEDSAIDAAKDSKYLTSAGTTDNFGDMPAVGDTGEADGSGSMNWFLVTPTAAPAFDPLPTVVGDDAVLVVDRSESGGASDDPAVDREDGEDDLSGYTDPDVTEKTASDHTLDAGGTEGVGADQNMMIGGTDDIENSLRYSFNIESEDLRDQIIEYIESVEGEVISGGVGFGNRTDDAEPLIMVIWNETEEDAAGIARYKEYSYTIYLNDMDYHTGYIYSSILNDYYTETRALADGNEVAAHLREMIGSGLTE